jgi:hypothetical protein
MSLGSAPAASSAIMSDPRFDSTDMLDKWGLSSILATFMMS